MWSGPTLKPAAGMPRPTRAASSPRRSRSFRARMTARSRPGVAGRSSAVLRCASRNSHAYPPGDSTRPGRSYRCRVASGRVPVPADAPLAGGAGAGRGGRGGHGVPRQLAVPPVRGTRRYQTTASTRRTPLPAVPLTCVCWPRPPTRAAPGRRPPARAGLDKGDGHRPVRPGARDPGARPHGRRRRRLRDRHAAGAGGRHRGAGGPRLGAAAAARGARRAGRAGRLRPARSPWWDRCTCRKPPDTGRATATGGWTPGGSRCPGWPAEMPYPVYGAYVLLTEQTPAEDPAFTPDPDRPRGRLAERRVRGPVVAVRGDGAVLFLWQARKEAQRRPAGDALPRRQGRWTRVRGVPTGAPRGRRRGARIARSGDSPSCWTA